MSTNIKRAAFVSLPHQILLKLVIKSFKVLNKSGIIIIKETKRSNIIFCSNSLNYHSFQTNIANESFIWKGYESLKDVLKNEKLGQNYLKIFMVTHTLKVFQFHQQLLITKHIPSNDDYINGHGRIIRSSKQKYHIIHINESNKTKYLYFFQRNYIPLLVHQKQHKLTVITFIVCWFIYCIIFFLIDNIL